MIDVLFDMETADPDDVFTLCFLTSHPAVNLRGVTITPGSDDQVGLVRRVLELTDHQHIPIGANGHDKSCVSAFHRKYLEWEPEKPDGSAQTVIANVLHRHHDVVLLTGAPLKNLHAFLLSGTRDRDLKRWVAQGGFAGDNIVPPEHRLEKFAGMETCPTFNFNGDPKGAELALTVPCILRRELVSKNVCHGVCYDKELHAFVEPHKDKTPGLALMYKGMDVYLKNKPNGKLFHDPLAAAALIDPSVCTFREVTMYRRGGKWGAKPSEGSNTFISIACDKQKFHNILVETQ